MKKFSLFFVAVFSLFAGVLLSACDFKTPKVKFSKEAISISITDTINFDEIVSLKDVDEEKVEYKFSSASFFIFENNVLTPTSYGQTMVYATYEGNSLDNFHLVVKKPFEQVANIEMDDSGLVTWNMVVDRFDETEDFVTASKYHIDIHFEDEDTSEESDSSFDLNSTSYQLVDNGKYTIKITAMAEGKFDASPVAEKVVYFGYMPQLTYEDFFFDLESEKMTWSEVAGATYSATFNGKELLSKSEENSLENSLSLAEELSALDAGDYLFTVTTHDKEGLKISKESESITISKLDAPTAEYVFDSEEGGQMKIIRGEGALKASAQVGEKSFQFDEEEALTSFEGVPSGENEVMLQSLAVTSKRDGVFYANSDIISGATIFKLDSLIVNGAGENEENADAINITFSSSTQTQETSFRTLLTLGDEVKAVTLDGFTAGIAETQRAIDLFGAGEYSLVAYNIPKVSTTASGAYIINSNLSEEFNFTKLATLPSVTHAYEGDVSTISFESASGALNYQLFVKNGAEYEAVGEELASYADGKFTFSGNVEDIFQDEHFIDGTITFKIVASGDDKSVISSATEKVLKRLSATTSESGDSALTTYSWSEVAGAKAYNLRYAYITSDDYDEMRAQTSFEDVIKVDKPSAELSAGQYYYVEIVATPEDENNNLNSYVFEDFFYISKQIETPSVTFGYDLEKATGDFVEASGFFVGVKNVENMTGTRVTVNGTMADYNFTGDGETFFLFLNKFENVSGDTLSVVATATDSRLYPDSTPYEVLVKRLTATESAIRSFVEIDEFSSKFTLHSGMEGVKEMYIKENDENFGTGDENNDAVLNISKMNGEYFTIKLFGSEFNSETHLYEIENVNGKNVVYIESAEERYKLSRINAPTDFKFYDGDFTFTTNESFGEYFVLDMKIDDVNGKNILIKVNVSDLELSIYDADTYALLLENTSLSGKDVLSKNGDSHTIDYDALLGVLKTNEEFLGYYSQAVKISFSLYNFQNHYIGNEYTVSSFNATTETGEDELVVKKMPTPNLAFDKTTKMLTWTIEEGNDNLSNTTFEVYGYEGSERKLLSTVNTKKYDVVLSQFTYSTDYRYEVVAKNPYYLESSASNEVLIRVLSPIEKVTLSENYLVVTPNSADVNFVASVKYDANSAGEQFVTTKTANSYRIQDLTAGTYTLNFVGTTNFEAEGKYYLDSQTSTFTLSAIEGIKPDDTSITYANNLVTFSALKESLQSLCYRVVFKDALGEIVSIKTQKNSLSVSPNDQLFKDLSEGEITIEVFAQLESYSVPNGGVIYFNNTKTAVGEEEYYNIFAYGESLSLLKLSSPSIDEINFVGEDANALRPSIEITISGTYGDNDHFAVYVNDNAEYVAEFLASEVKTEDGKYKLILEYDSFVAYFEEGKENNIFVAVASTENIPSSMVAEKVYFANALASIQQKEDEYGFTQEIEISFASENDVAYASGGIMLEVTFTPKDGDEEVKYLTIESKDYVGDKVTVDLSSFFAENLLYGGSLSYRAFVKSDNLNKILASDAIESATYEILATPTYEEGAGSVTLTNEGFVIGNTASGNINPGASYLVSYSNGENYVTAIIGEEEEYLFTYPDAWISGEEYSIDVVAFENGKISSLKSTFIVTLNRLDRVQNVVFARDEQNLNRLTLSWDEVVGAEIYLVRAYVDASEGKLLVGEGETGVNSISIFDIFGDNYEKLSSFVASGVNIYFEITVTTSNLDYQNSQIKLVKTSLIGTLNNLNASDMSVDDNGALFFNSVSGQKYLYSIFSVDGRNILLPWTEVTANGDTVKIDISNAMEIGEADSFRVRVVLAGDAKTEGTLYNDDSIVLKLDSQYIESTKVFMQTKAPTSVGVNTVDNSKLSVTLSPIGTQTLIEKIFVSLKPNFDNSAVFVEGIYDDVLADVNSYIYSINMSLLLEKYDLTADTKVYIYAKQQSIENEIYFVTSKPMEYEYKALAPGSVKDVRKVTEGENADLMRSYIVFDDRTNLTGFNIIVDYINPLNGDETKRFNVMLQIDGTTYIDGVHKTDALATRVNGEILIDVYALLENLNTVFDYDNPSQIVSPNLSGEGNYSFKISEVASNGGEISFGSYITKFGEKDLLFSKLPKALTVTITDGNVNWLVDENYLSLTEKFYIFLYDSENENNFNRYEADLSTRTFDGTLFNASGSTYNLSLALVSSDPFTVASTEKFVGTTEEDAKAVIVKNKFNSQLKLSNGVLSIDFDSNVDWSAGGDKSRDFYEFFAGIRDDDGDGVPDVPTTELAHQLVTTTFYYPFTFTLKDLVEGNVRIRFRFTSYQDADKTTISFRRVADVNAIHIFTGELLGTSDIDKLTTLGEQFSAVAANNEERNIIVSFFNILKFNIGGIGGYNNIFDSAFEAVQEGMYKIEYCLLGNSSTLTSEWQVLVSGENQDFYVNQTVHVESGVDDVYVNGEKDIVRAYYLKIYRSQIYTSGGAKKDASTYYMQIYTQGQTSQRKQAIEITSLNGVTWTAKLVGVDGSSFSVQAVDENDDGEYDYLKLYLNISVDENGTKGYDAILSQYLDVFEKGSYYFEVFARGDNYSISSKSALFALVMRSACEDFSINNGVFSWTAYRNSSTTVIYKASSQNEPSDPIVIGVGEESKSTFSLNDLPAGEYDYIKFASLGEITGSTITLDSEVYIIENIIKLASPNVASELNAFALTDNNDYRNIYSNDRTVRYEVNNNNNEDGASFVFTAQDYDSNIKKAIYEAGMTESELNADEFYFTTLGSTASYAQVRDAHEVNVFHLELENNEANEIYSAVKSNSTSSSGKMLPSVPTVSVRNGIVVWNEMSLSPQTGFGIGDGQVVYEIAVQFYEITNATQSSVISNIGTEIVAYTTKTSFDLAKIEEQYPSIVGNRVEYVKVTLQAYVLGVSDTLPTGRSYLSLVEGGYAYGNEIKYTSLDPQVVETPYILRSNGNDIDGLQLADSVTDLNIIDGRLTWQYNNADVTFIVTDESGREISGVVETADDVHYVFTEDAGEIMSGSQTINVYVVSNEANTLKSRKTSMEIFKLASVQESVDETGDYTTESVLIETSNGAISAEILDFTNYFEKNETEFVVNLNFEGDTSFSLTSENAKILIFSSQDDYNAVQLALPSVFSEYASVIIVEDKLDVRITASNASENVTNVLSSDVYSLVLTRPTADYTISWDADTGTFSWFSPTQTEDENTLFILDVTYLYTSGGTFVEEDRRYEITYQNGGIVKEFTPTVTSSSISFSLIVKSAKQGLQSQQMEYEISVAFNLFSGGDGTSSNPYVISSLQQFKNIGARKTKLSYLNSYLSDGEEKTEDDRYNFLLNADITGLTFDGILFSGDFTGNIVGNGHTITYTANAPTGTNLSSSLFVEDGAITRFNTSDSRGFEFRTGVALFERVTGSLSNFTVNATFNSSMSIDRNTLFAGLTIVNMSTARIDGVNVSGLSTTASVYSTIEQTVAVYAGLVAFNNGEIVGSKVTGDIVATDANYSGVQNIFVAGVVYNSTGVIRGCALEGNVVLDLQNTGGGQHQVAGIAVTTTRAGEFENNSIGANSKIEAKGVDGNSHKVYIAGFAVYARGTINETGMTVEGCTVVTNIGGTVYQEDDFCDSGLR